MSSEVTIQPQQFEVVLQQQTAQVTPQAAGLAVVVTPQVSAASFAPQVVQVTPTMQPVTVVTAAQQGPAGPPGQSSGAVAKIAFAYGDASPNPVIELAAGTTVFAVLIAIQTPFNGVGASLQLGDAAQSDRLLAASQCDPSQRAEYESSPGYTYTSPTEILLTINPGAGCTQGAGYLFLEV